MESFKQFMEFLNSFSLVRIFSLIVCSASIFQKGSLTVSQLYDA